MSKSLTITTSGSNDRLLISLAGQIDEDADYSSIVGSSAKHITFDLHGVTLINSTGIRNWVDFLGSISDEAHLDFANCPVRVVNQLNLFPGFFGGRQYSVISFQAPYYCPDCDSSENVLISEKDEFEQAAKAQAPIRQCSTCGANLEFDGIEKKYFLFLMKKS